VDQAQHARLLAPEKLLSMECVRRQPSVGYDLCDWKAQDWIFVLHMQKSLSYGEKEFVLVPSLHRAPNWLPVEANDNHNHNHNLGANHNEDMVIP
jgi:hypothetical protein